MDTPIKLAIVGCGAVTDAKHLPAARQSRAISVAALVDAKIGNARALAAKHRLQTSKIASDIEAVVNMVDGVLIATPNHSHFSLAQIALSRALPVLVEKPLTTSYDDAIALCELAERQRTFISVGYSTRHHSSVRVLKDLLQNGHLGRMRSFHYEHGLVGGWEPISDYNLDAQRAGGGVLIVQGTHFVDRMLYFFGYPDSFEYADDNHGGVEANCRAKLHFQNDLGSFYGSFFISKTRRLMNQLTLYTDFYVVVLDEYGPEDVRLFPLSWPRIALSAFQRNSKPGDQHPSPSQVQLEEFASVIRNGGQLTVDGRTAAQSVKLIEDMYRHRTQLDEPWLTYQLKIPEACPHV